jgi:hypothetical protein
MVESRCGALLTGANAQVSLRTHQVSDHPSQVRIVAIDCAKKKQAATISGVSHSAVYQRSLGLKKAALGGSSERGRGHLVGSSEHRSGSRKCGSAVSSWTSLDPAVGRKNEADGRRRNNPTFSNAGMGGAHAFAAWEYNTRADGFVVAPASCRRMVSGGTGGKGHNAGPGRRGSGQK